MDEEITKFQKKEKEDELIKQIIVSEEKEENIIEKLRRKTIENINTKVLAVTTLSIIVFGLLFGFEIAIILFVLIATFLFIILKYPEIKDKRKYNDLNQELPYALRHMGTELKSGKGLHDSLTTISNSNYGSLSDEFKRVLEEIKYGTSNEKSLLDMADRVNSEGLKRAIQQIITTLRVGGNLANSLNIIANDITFDMQIKLKEYAQKLNGFILIYTFIAILGPVVLLILLMAASAAIGDLVPSSLIWVLYVFFFPLVVIFMGLFMQRLEPKI